LFAPVAHCGTGEACCEENVRVAAAKPIPNWFFGTATAAVRAEPKARVKLLAARSAMIAKVSVVD